MTAPAAVNAADAPPASWRETLSRLLTLAWPIVLARIGLMSMGLVDSIAVGRFSARELGYHALGWAPTAIVVTTGVGLLLGAQVVTARRVGEGRSEMTGAVLRRGLVYAFWIGVVTTAALALGGPTLMRSLGLEPDLARGAGRALQVFALSLTPVLLGETLIFWLEGLGRPRPGMWAMLAANIVNLALNLVLVTGSFGLPALGAVGAGWATFGARLTLFGALAFYVLRMPDARAHGVFAPTPREPEAAREQRRVGYGAGASWFVEAGAFVGMNVVAGWLGAVQVAAWAVFLNYSAMVFMLPLGLSGATAVLVGNAFGAGDRRAVVRAAVTGAGVVTVLATVIALLTVPAAGLVASAYATDPVLIAAAAAALVFTAAFFPPDALQAVMAQASRARGDVLIPTLIHVVCYAGLMLPLGWWLAHRAGHGLRGCLEAVLLASYVAGGLQAIRFAWTSRRTAGRA